MKIYPK